MCASISGSDQTKQNGEGAFLEWGRDVLLKEAEALKEASDRLGDAFTGAAARILECTGKVITTGLGKSGHVAQKLASTLASTGTSAHFLHPVEALHGDLGMVQPNDCLIAIAYGGKTQEVIQVALHAKRLGVPIISITGQKDSPLSKLADFFLDGSVRREAGPLGLAPTCSSTVALGLGDALAMALKRARNFKDVDFALFHPGGTMGKRLSQVLHHYRKLEDIPNVSWQAPLETILSSIGESNLGILAVKKDTELVGCITDGDLRRILVRHRGSAFDKIAEQLMTSNPILVSECALAIDAFSIMEKKRITNLFVHSDKNPSKVIGVVSMHDLLAAKII